MAPSLDKLPGEVMQQIFQHITTTDTSESREVLKSLRLSGSRVLSQMATEALFRTAAFWFEFKSLQKLSSIAEKQNL